MICEQEILLHWADRPDTPSISTEDHNMLTRLVHINTLAGTRH